MNIQMDLTGKVAVITGGGRGIGRSIALAMADAGADIVVTARTASQIEAVAEEVQAKGRRSLAIPADVADAAQVTDLVDRTMQEFGTVHILVNNAGTIRPVPMVDHPEEVWDEIININLKGVFLCTRAVGKHMVAQQYGKIINIASIGGIVADPFFSAYHASKGAVLLFTKSVALEWARHNINVNAIAPGLVTTDLLAGADEKRMEKLARTVPMGRIAEPDEIAPLAVFLASDLSSYMVGECVVIDGGKVST